MSVRDSIRRAAGKSISSGNGEQISPVTGRCVCADCQAAHRAIDEKYKARRAKIFAEVEEIVAQSKAWRNGQ